MANDLESFFNTNDFDIHEPHSGHLERFKRKLNHPKKKSSVPWHWLSIAASIILVLGFYLGQLQKTDISLTKIAPNMAETESYFMITIKQELKEIEKHRNIETETLIEDALDEIEELEEQYQTFIKELSKNNNKKLMIQNLINNYQQRLTVLENLLTKLEYQNNPTKFELKYDEII